MKIEMTESHYADSMGFKLTGAGVHEVDDERGKYLLSTFPEWFVLAEGEVLTESMDVEADQSTDQENDEPEAPQNESDAAQPSKPLSKMNKDELVALAGELGVDVTDGMTNKQLIEAIKAKQEG